MRQQLVGGLRENYLNRHKPGHGCYGRTIVFLTSQRRVRGLRDNYSEPGNAECGGCGRTVHSEAVSSPRLEVFYIGGVYRVLYEITVSRLLCDALVVYIMDCEACTRIDSDQPDNHNCWDLFRHESWRVGRGGRAAVQAPVSRESCSCLLGQAAGVFFF